MIKLILLLGTKADCATWKNRHYPDFIFKDADSLPEDHRVIESQVSATRTLCLRITSAYPTVMWSSFPTIGYVINNEIIRWLKGDGGPGIDPAMVGAWYVDGDNAVDLMDREDTGLIDMGPYEQYSDQLEDEFDDLLYGPSLDPWKPEPKPWRRTI